MYHFGNNSNRAISIMNRKSITDHYGKKKTEKVKVRRGHNPNHIPSRERRIYIILSSFILLYGTFGILMDDLFIPGKRSKGVHLHGEPAWIMYSAFLCAVANMLSIVVDHYDRRNNENNYKLFARITQTAGWTLFLLAFLSDIFIFHKGTR